MCLIRQYNYSRTNIVFICCLKSIKNFIGEEKLKTFISFCLKYIADVDIPVKRYMYIVCLIILSTLLMHLFNK